MNGSKKWGFVWWSVGGCASRATRGFFSALKIPDFSRYDYTKGGLPRKDRYNGLVHTQGIPPDLEGLPILANCRNPYSKTVHKYSYWEKAVAEREDYHDVPWVSFGDYIGAFDKKTMQFLVNPVSAPWIEWDRLGYPTYHIRMEHLKEDFLKIKPIIDNTDPEFLEEVLNENFSQNHYMNLWHDRKYDENGLRMWKHYYNQELADRVYDLLKEGFELCGYDRDSWKQ